MARTAKQGEALAKILARIGPADPSQVAEAAEQAGLFTDSSKKRSWAACALTRAVKTGHVVRVRRGVYAAASEVRRQPVEWVGVPSMGQIPPELIEESYDHLVKTFQLLNRACGHTHLGTEEYLTGVLNSLSHTITMLSIMIERHDLLLAEKDAQPQHGGQQDLVS